MAASEETVSPAGFRRATARMAELRQGATAVAARYDRRRDRIVVSLESGVEVAFPPGMAEGLADASGTDLAVVEITPSGLGLHWPRLDADVYLPALLSGVLGTRQWAAAALGSAGGRTRTQEKADAARENGRRGGRPRSARK